MYLSRRHFGTPDQQALERRADLMWQLVDGDPRYSCHGRAVALLDNRAEAVTRQIALARLQGVGPSPRLTPEVARQRTTAIEAEGLVTDVYEHWSCEASTALIHAKTFLVRHRLPDGLTMGPVDIDTSDAVYDALDALTQSCGVLLPASGFLKGRARPAVCLYAQTAEGEIACVAASVAENPDSALDAGRAWWGMLSTAEAWRGHGLAKHLGAQTLVHMVEQHRIARFGTGIRSGNTASERLCAGLGFASSGLCDLMAIDPTTMSGGRMTK